MSIFNPESFLTESTTEAGSVAYTPVPEKELKIIVAEMKPRVVGADSKPVLDVTFKVDDDEAREATGMAEPKIRTTFWLDLTGSGGLDMSRGKNVKLNQLRDALGQNVPGKAWAPSMLLGQVCIGKVKHSINKGDGVTVEASIVSYRKL